MALCWPLKIPSTAKFVLVALADNANDAGFCWPSISTICERTSLGKTAVIDAIRWLEEAGYIAANRSNGRKTTYTVTVQECLNDKQTGSPDGPVSASDQSATQTGAAGEPVREDNRSGKRTGPPNGHNRSASRTGPVRQADTNRHITIKNRQHMFERFWEAYPRKVSKGRAQRAFDKLKPDEHLLQTILAALDQARLTPGWTRDGGRFIPYPATWLNDRGWEDELEPATEDADQVWAGAL